MIVNYVLMYGTPYLKYREFETFEDISKFIVNRRIFNYSIFKKLEDKEEIEMIYRDSDINYLENKLNNIEEVLDKIKEYVLEEKIFDYDKIKSENTGTNCYKKDLDHSIDAERYALILMKDLGLAPVV